MDSRILTIPNVITLVRAFCIPAFLYTYLSLHNGLLSFIIITIGAVTDYADGKVARWLGQESKLGAALDPAIDRAYIAATVIALAIRNVVPSWIPIILICRDLWLAVILFRMRKSDAGLLEVTFLGKSATFSLLYALPFLLLSDENGIGRACAILGWSFAIWGIGLYLLTGIEYSRAGIKVLRKN